MTILLIICDSLEERGGVEKIVTLQANYYAKKGFSVYIFTRYKQFKKTAYELNEKVEVLSYKWNINATGLKKLFYFYGFRKWIRENVNFIKPDVIQTHGLNVGVLSIFGLKKLRCKIISCDHNHFANANRVWHFLRNIAYRKINTVVSLTKEDLPKFLKINSSSVCIYNPVSMENMRFGYSKNKIVLAVGRYTKQKGFDMLIDAWNIVNAKHPDWKLKIIGEGVEKNYLEKKIKNYGLLESVKLYPPTSNIVKEYNNSNLFVLSSRYEGFCLVLIEAMTVGLPVISFACKTGPEEILANGGGVLVKPESIGGLANAIMNFIDNPQDWDEISLSAKENAKYFTIENYFKEWDRIIYGISIKK